MSVTVRGSDILFPDGSTISTNVSSISAGTIYTSPSSNSATGANNTWLLSSNKIYVTKPGTVRIRLTYMQKYTTTVSYGGGYDYTYYTTYYRVYQNGGAVGTQYTATSSLQTVTQDFTVNAGDYFQLGNYCSYSSGSTTSNIVVGVSSGLYVGFITQIIA